MNEPQVDPIRVLICDDHMAVRAGLTGLFRARQDILAVGEAADGAEAVEKCRLLKPDVVLMDLNMPHMDGVEATRQICQESLSTRVVVVTGVADDRVLHDALQAGAAGYLRKSASAQEIVAAIHDAHQGITGLTPNGVASHVRSQEREQAESVALNAREQSVLAHLVAGSDDEAIAHQMNLSQSAVVFTVSAILLKLGVRSRVEAAEVAIQRGLHRPA